MISRGRTSLGGQTLEQVIKALRLVDFEVMPMKEYRKLVQGNLFAPTRLLVQNHPYTTIFGTPGRREYYIISSQWTGELECKFQNQGGSVDEKMVYIAETLKRTALDRLAVVYGGAFWTKQKRGQAVIKWMKAETKAIRHTYGKELLVMDFDQFLTWVKRTWGR